MTARGLEAPPAGQLKALTFASVNGVKSARDLVEDLEEIIERTIDATRAHDRDRALELLSAASRAGAVAFHLGYHFNSANAEGLESYIECNLESAHSSAQDAARILEGLAGIEGIDIQRVRARAALLVTHTDHVRRMASPAAFRSKVEDGPARVSALACAVTSVATLLLPGAARERYAEEWRAELGELVLDPRRAQRAYALRVLVRSPRLRIELTRTKRRAVRGS